MTPRRRALGIAALALLPHLPVLNAGFVYDDDRFVVSNAGIQTLQRPASLIFDPARTCSPPDRTIWRPLRTLGFALQYRLFGARAAGYHAVSLLLWGLAVLALARLVSRVDGRASVATLAALLWAWHPLTVEAVAWISSQGDLLAALLVCCALLAAPAAPVLAALLGGLALLAKESALPLCLALLALARSAGERAGRLRSAGLWLAILTLAYLVVRQQVLGLGFGLGVEGFGQREAPLAERGLVFCQNLIWSLRLFVFPRELAVDYAARLPAPDGGDVLGAGLALLTLGLLALFLRRRAPAAGAGLVVALLFFLPTSGLAPVKARLAERFLLLPAAGLSLAASAMLACLPRRVTVVLGVALLAVLGTRTAQRTLDWRSDATLFTAELAANPASVQARVGLAAVAFEEGRLEDAERAYRDIVNRSTTAADARRLLALVRLAEIDFQRQRPEAAVVWLEECRRSILQSPPSRWDPVLHLAWVGLGNQVRVDRGPEEAAALYQEGLRLFGSRSRLLEGLGICQDQQGDPEGAEGYYREALALGEEPRSSLWYHLALALVHQGRSGPAVQALREALDLDPDDGRARALLAELGGG